MSIKLLHHQQKVLDFLSKYKNRGLIIFHSVGAGKTITSLITAYTLHLKYPEKNILITAPVSILNNYTKEIKKLNIDFNGKLIILSYVKFINNMKNNNVCKDSILIIDEAHNFNKASGKRAVELMKCAHKAFKVLLLTATPVKNQPIELANLYSMITEVNNIKLIQDKIKLFLQNPKKYSDFLKCKISYFKNEDIDNYPSSTEHFISLKMSSKYYKEYYNIQENIRLNLPDIYANTKELQEFANGIRRAVNLTSEQSPKIKWIIDKIKEDIKNNKKVLVYSTWLTTGIDIIIGELKKESIKFSQVTGDTKINDRKINVDKYNEGKYKVIIVTSAGAEGLDLKETRSVIIMEPHWNYAKIEQIIGRAIRYKSHERLPLKNRHVDIYHLVLVKPLVRLFNFDSIGTADQMLIEMSYAKKNIIDTFYKELKSISIEEDSSCN